MADAAGLHLEMFDTIKDRDISRLRELLHSDYTYTDGSGVEIKSVDAGVAVIETFLKAFPDLAFEITRHHSTGDVSIIEFSATGTHQAELEGIPATGKRVEVVVCNVIEAKDGKVYREREYYDTVSMLKQLGVME